MVSGPRSVDVRECPRYGCCRCGRRFEGFCLPPIGDSNVLARLRGDEGANAVEFALIFPLLLVLVFGIFWGGIALNQKLTITQSAREGARMGATVPLPVGEELPDESWFTAVADRIVNSSSGELSTTSGPGAFCVRFVNPDKVAAPKSEERVYPPGATINCDVDDTEVASEVRVEVVTIKPVRLDFILFDLSRSVQSDSIARFEPDIDP